MSYDSQPVQEIREAYLQAVRDYQLRFAVVGAILAMILMPFGLTLDYVMYPEMVGQFLGIRLTCTVIVSIGFALYFTSLGKRHARLVTFGWIFGIQASMCGMIYLTEGAGSPYYAGLNLVMLATGVVLPLSAAEVAIFGLGTLLLYLATILLHPGGPLDTPFLYNNIYFIGLTALISATASHFHGKRRFTEFRMSYDLGARNKELAELDQLKSQFFANISHELRTPLTLIIAPLQDLLQGQYRLPDRVARSLATARDNALRLLKLVNDLLEVIRLEEGKAEFQRQPIAIGTLVGGVIDAMSHLAEARGVALVKQLGRSPVFVLGDRHALEKIFFNLLGNALKFTDVGGTITVTQELAADGHIHIAVRDTGIGISEQELPFVFDRFRQAASSGTRRYQGTGLGLALVKELVERHGGGIDLKSRLGLGTTAIIELPLAPDQSTREIGLPQPDQEDPLKAIFLAAERQAGLPMPAPVDEFDGYAAGTPQPSVLVVDDEPDMRRYLVELLSEHYRVMQAADGRIGLELARRLQPDLMLLDLMLPELDGLEVCRRLKQNPDTRGIKLILLTARVDEAAKLTALSNGADDFLTKPFSSVEVKTRLKNLLQTASLERDLQGRNDTLEETLARLQRTQAQLIQSEKLNALGSLSAGLLHEVNNPLNYALTALKLARRQAVKLPDGDIDEMLGDIDDGMQRIRRIVTDLRAFAYPSEGDHQPFLLHEAVAHAIQFTAHEHEAIRIHNRVPPQLQLSGSRSHIVQVLINLLSNAGKAVAAAGRPGEILIDGEMTESRYRLRVRDNGVGMDAVTLSRVFDPFFTTRDVGHGMGLGLSVCHTIIGNHGGQLTAASEPGAGTEFCFDLPLATPSPATEPA